MSLLVACSAQPERAVSASESGESSVFSCEYACEAEGAAAVQGDMPAALNQAKQVALNKLETNLKTVYIDHPPYPVLEKAVRDAVVDRLSFPAVSSATVVDMHEGEGRVSVRVRLLKTEFKALAEPRMQAIQDELKSFIHLGDSGSRLEQLKRFLPALPLIEEYKRYQVWLDLPQNELVAALDRKVTILFHRLLVTLKESIPEAQAYEKELKNALLQRGVLVSAKRPDLVLEYYMDTTRSDSGIQALVDMVLLQADAQRPFTDYRDDFAFSALSEEQRAQWVNAVSDAVFKALYKKLIDLVYPGLEAQVQGESD